jgi:rsbT co-antagonist protein RsbR
MTISAPAGLAQQDVVAALQQRNAELERMLQAAEQRAQLYEEILQQMPASASVWHLEQPNDPHSFRLIAANPLTRQTVGFDMRAVVGKLVSEVFPGLPEQQLQLFAKTLHSGQPHKLGEILPSGDPTTGPIFVVQAIPLPNSHLCIMGENITERKRAEAMLRQSKEQEDMIRAQQAVLAELSTPLIPISERVMVMPLIGGVDSRRAQQVLETLLEGVASSHAQIAILDITGVPVVDTQVADALVRAAQAVKLLGAQVVLTGIRPEVAQTLVGLGTDLASIVTRSSLQSGIAYATSHTS